MAEWRVSHRFCRFEASVFDADRMFIVPRGFDQPQEHKVSIWRPEKKSISPCLPRTEVLASVTEDIKMSKPSDLVQGTLDMLLLKILRLRR